MKRQTEGHTKRIKKYARFYIEARFVVIILFDDKNWNKDYYLQMIPLSCLCRQLSYETGEVFRNIFVNFPHNYLISGRSLIAITKDIRGSITWKMFGLLSIR